MFEIINAMAPARPTHLLDCFGILIVPRFPCTSHVASSISDAEIDVAGRLIAEPPQVYERLVPREIAGTHMEDAAVTPRNASKVLFHCDGVVYCGERRDMGGLDLPGGKAERAETPRACALREIAEELQYAHTGTTVALEDSLAAAPSAQFLFEAEDCCFDVHVFLVECEAGTTFELTQEGKRELANPAWRRAEALIADLEISRRPAAAGHAYAMAVRALLPAVH